MPDQSGREGLSHRATLPPGSLHGHIGDKVRTRNSWEVGELAAPSELSAGVWRANIDIERKQHGP